VSALTLEALKGSEHNGELGKEEVQNRMSLFLEGVVESNATGSPKRGVLESTDRSNHVRTLPLSLLKPREF
jgi:hypothetical protein